MRRHSIGLCAALTLCAFALPSQAAIIPLDAASLGSPSVVGPATCPGSACSGSFGSTANEYNGLTSGSISDQFTFDVAAGAYSGMIGCRVKRQRSAHAPAVARVLRQDTVVPASRTRAQGVRQPILPTKDVVEVAYARMVRRWIHCQGSSVTPCIPSFFGGHLLLPPYAIVLPGQVKHRVSSPVAGAQRVCNVRVSCGIISQRT